VRIVLVDWSEVFRMGLRALLAQARDVAVVGEAADLSTGLDVVRAQAPDLVLTDLDLAGGSGLPLALAIHEVAPVTRVVLLAATANEVSVRQAAVSGVRGYLLKSQPSHEILAAVLDVLADRPIDPPPVLEASATGGDAVRTARAAVLNRLSAREREIFDLIIWGQTNKQVAIKLGISVKTVETHRSHINGKLQVHSAAELVRLASLCGALSARDGETIEAASLATARGSREKSPGKTAVERSSIPPRLVAKIG
jgi:DNA-binding NarL/FixJ family response regulator